MLPNYAKGSSISPSSTRRKEQMLPNYEKGSSISPSSTHRKEQMLPNYERGSQMLPNYEKGSSISPSSTHRKEQMLPHYERGSSISPSSTHRKEQMLPNYEKGSSVSPSSTHRKEQMLPNYENEWRCARPAPRVLGSALGWSRARSLRLCSEIGCVIAELPRRAEETCLGCGVGSRHLPDLPPLSPHGLVLRWNQCMGCSAWGVRATRWFRLAPAQVAGPLPNGRGWQSHVCDRGLVTRTRSRPARLQAYRANAVLTGTGARNTTDMMSVYLQMAVWSRALQKDAAGSLHHRRFI